MSASLINQSGILNLQYQVYIETKGSYVSVSLYGQLPGAEEAIYLDSVTGGFLESTSSGIMEAMLKAENKWGLDLIKLQPDNLKVQ